MSKSTKLSQGTINMINNGIENEVIIKSIENQITMYERAERTAIKSMEEGKRIKGAYTMIRDCLKELNDDLRIMQEKATEAEAETKTETENEMNNTVKCPYCQKELKPQANGLIRRHKTDRKAPKVKEFIGTSFWWGSCIGAGKPQGLDGLLMVIEDVKKAENERQHIVARSYIEMESLKRIREEDARHVERIYKHINKMIAAEFEAITKHKAFQ